MKTYHIIYNPSAVDVVFFHLYDTIPSTAGDGGCLYRVGREVERQHQASRRTREVDGDFGKPERSKINHVLMILRVNIELLVNI